MKHPHTRAWLSEFAGTTILLLASVLVTRWLFGPHSALGSAVPGLPGRMAIDGAVIGAVIGLLIISPIGRSSGGHFNPAVTVTLWLLRGLPGRDAAAYVAAQLAARWPACCSAGRCSAPSSRLRRLTTLRSGPPPDGPAARSSPARPSLSRS